MKTPPETLIDDGLIADHPYSLSNNPPALLYDPDQARDEDGKWTGESGGSGRHPATMTGGAINKELDKLEQLSTQLIDEMIVAGRGHEKTSEFLKKTDPLSMELRQEYERRSALRQEVEARYGPGAPSRLPKGFGPIKKLAEQTDDLRTALDHLEGDALTELRRLLTVARDTLSAFVLRHPDDLTGYLRDLRLKGASDIQNVVKEWLRGTYEAGAKALRREAKQYKQKQPLYVPTDALRWLNEKALHISGVLKQRVLDAAKQALLTSLKQGESTQAAVQRLEAVFEPYVGNDTVLEDGEPLSPHRLEAVVRTNTTEAFNQGRMVQAQEYADVLHGMRYSIILDERTTEVCKLLDGWVIPLDDPALAELMPPNHVNCRSCLVPVPITEEVDAEDFITEDIVGRAKLLAGEGFT